MINLITKKLIICSAVCCILLSSYSFVLATDSPPDNDNNIVLNFDDADLYEVIRTIAELLKINYIIEPTIQGKVTIHTAGHLKKKELFPIFFQILETNGLTAIKEGSFYKIDKLKEASRMPILPQFGHSKKRTSPDERVIIQIIPLTYIAAQEMTKVLTPFISADGTIISHEDSNTLLVVDKKENIFKVLKLISVFDIDVFQKINHRFYPLKHIDAEEVSETLTEVVAAYGTAAKKEEIKVIPIERINTLVVISQNPRIFRRIEEFLRRMDVPGQDTDPKIYVYSVKNGQADELSELLNNVFSHKSESTAKKVTASSETSNEKDASSQEGNKPKTLLPGGGSLFGDTGSSRKPSKKGTPSATRTQMETSGSGTLKGEVRIVPDTIRNALVIEALPGDYRIIENLLTRLDILPRQVLIEVTVVDISLDAKEELGIDWEYEKADTSLSTSLLNASVTSDAGLNVKVGAPYDRWFAMLKAKAHDNKIHILSSPTVLASDNKEAKIDISTEIPVASAQYQYDSNSDGILQTNIEYRDTGIILSVTPHINEHGLVSMDISQEVSETSDSVTVGTEEMSSFYKRSISTTLTVKNGQTIMIGGLMKETNDNYISGIPCLLHIPVLGYVFGQKTDAKIKSELIILITPHVITHLEDVDAVTETFKSRMGNIIKRDENTDKEDMFRFQNSEP